jgi:hypothetical protein
LIDNLYNSSKKGGQKELLEQDQESTIDKQSMIRAIKDYVKSQLAANVPQNTPKLSNKQTYCRETPTKVGFESCLEHRTV